MTAIGHIYKIICTVDEKFCYIGSTFNRLDKRMNGHRDDYHKWLDGRPRSCACCEYFKKYGIEKFKMVLIKSYEVCRAHNKDRRHLEAYETLWINKTKCCNKNLAFNPLQKEQRKQYRQDNREALNAKNKEFYQNNKEQRCAKSKQWYQDNKERRCAKSKQWYQDNKEAIAAKSKQWYQDNKERRCAKSKQWYQDNKEAIAAKRRAKRLADMANQEK